MAASLLWPNMKVELDEAAARGLLEYLMTRPCNEVLNAVQYLTQALMLAEEQNKESK